MFQLYVKDVTTGDFQPVGDFVDAGTPLTPQGSLDWTQVVPAVLEANPGSVAAGSIFAVQNVGDGTAVKGAMVARRARVVDDPPLQYDEL